jgi:hypothetical protein
MLCSIFRWPTQTTHLLISGSEIIPAGCKGNSSQCVGLLHDRSILPSQPRWPHQAAADIRAVIANTCRPRSPGTLKTETTFSRGVVSVGGDNVDRTLNADNKDRYFPFTSR